MSTTKNIKQLLTSVKCLNRFDFSFDFNHDNFTDEINIYFTNSVQCAMMYCFLHEMLIECTSIFLESRNKITILVVNHDICHNIDA